MGKITAITPEQLGRCKEVRDLAIEEVSPYIFWVAYHRGHNDTVDGDYVDVLPVDCNDYWKDEARIAAGEYDEEFRTLKSKPVRDV